MLYLKIYLIIIFYYYYMRLFKKIFVTSIFFVISRGFYDIYRKIYKWNTNFIRFNEKEKKYLAQTLQCQNS